MTVSIIEDLNI